ncbi:MAG: hypothetical protein MK135_11830 [Polyangiaceae bacterium]|nr:hypothetical protein [Polyangiaceae bacterium]
MLVQWIGAADGGELRFRPSGLIRYFESEDCIVYLDTPRQSAECVWPVFDLETQSLSITAWKRRLGSAFFALIFDKQTGELHCLRDRSGQRSGYYQMTAGQVSVGSLAAEVNACYQPQALCTELALFKLGCSGYLPTGQSLFPNVKEVLPGEHLVFSPGQLQPRRLELLEHRLTAKAEAQDRDAWVSG